MFVVAGPIVLKPAVRRIYAHRRQAYGNRNAETAIVEITGFKGVVHCHLDFDVMGPPKARLWACDIGVNFPNPFFFSSFIRSGSFVLSSQNKRVTSTCSKTPTNVWAWLTRMGSWLLIAQLLGDSILLIYLWCSHLSDRSLKFLANEPQAWSEPIAPK